MFEDKFSCIKTVVKTVHIALPSAFVTSEIAGVIEILESWKRQYVQQLKGIVVSYKNVSLVSNSGFIVIDKPFLHYDVKATFDIFYPTVGSIVKGTINRVSLNHIGCLVHGTINATIHLASEHSYEISEFIQLDRQILFQVTHFDFQRKIVRVKGKITPECIRLMKDLYPCFITNQTLDSSISTEFSSTEVTNNFKSMKKKKKHDRNFDTISSTEDINNIAAVGESYANNADDMNSNCDTMHFSNATMASFISKSAKKKNRNKYLDLNCSSENVTSGISSAESNALSPDNTNLDCDSNPLSNVKLTTLSSKSPKKKKKHEKHFDSNSSIDSMVLNTNAYSSSTPAINHNASHLNLYPSCLSNVGGTSFNSKKAKKKKKHEKHLDINSSMKSMLLNKANTDCFSTPVIKNSADDLDADFMSSFFEKSERNSLLSDAETVDFSTYIESQSSEREKFSVGNNSILESKLPSKRKKSGNQKDSSSLSPEKLIKTENKPVHFNVDASSQVTKSPKKKKHKTSNEESSSEAPKTSDKDVFTNFDHENCFLEIKQEPIATTVSVDKTDKSAQKTENCKRKRELSLSESPTGNSPKKKKRKHDKKEVGKKSSKLKKEKVKSKRNDKHKKSDKSSSLNKSKEKKEKPVKNKKEKKKSRNKKEKQNTDSKSKHKKNKKSSHSKDKTSSENKEF